MAASTGRGSNHICGQDLPALAGGPQPSQFDDRLPEVVVVLCGHFPSTQSDSQAHRVLPVVVVAPSVLKKSPPNRNVNFGKRARAIHRHAQRQRRAAPGNHAYRRIWIDRQVELTRFRGHFILAEGRRKEIHRGSALEVPGRVPG
jgi:hypothetical protein